MGDAVFAIVLKVVRIKKMIGRIETRTRDRIYCQTMRTVRDISRDDRARIAICSLRTPTDRQTDRLKVNFSIDKECVNQYGIMCGAKDATHLATRIKSIEISHESTSFDPAKNSRFRRAK